MAGRAGQRVARRGAASGRPDRRLSRRATICRRACTPALDAEKISHLNEDLIRARADLAAADARLDAARGRAGAAAQAAIAPSVVPLRASLDQLTAQFQAQTSRLGANHPDVRSSLRRNWRTPAASVDAEVARVVAATDQDRRAGSRAGDDAGAQPAGRADGRGRGGQGADPAERHATRRGGLTRAVAGGAGTASSKPRSSTRWKRRRRTRSRWRCRRGSQAGRARCR